MDSELRKRTDIGLILLAVIAGATVVTASETTDVATVAAGIIGGVLLTTVTLLLIRTPTWARNDADS